MTDSDLRLGRRWAHGRRFAPTQQRRDAGDVILSIGASRGTARGLLGRALRATGPRGVRVRPEEADVSQVLAAAGILRLEEVVEGTVAAPRWVPWRVTLAPGAEAEVREVLGRLDPAAERRELLADTDGSVLLAREVELLGSQDAQAPLVPPPASVLAGSAWTTYASALRAAAGWERAEREGERLSARELGARVLGSSKAWTPARRGAFERLVGHPFEQVLGTMERFVRVRGPLRWHTGERTGDARSANPWVGLPATAVAELELDASDAVGALVVENLETFEEVLRRTTVGERWVCVYGGGYAGSAEVNLVARLALPLLAWCDLDPDGVGIAADLARRSGLNVIPVAMEPAFLNGPYAVSATGVQRDRARELALSVPLALKPLAAAIADVGRVCEQEALHGTVLDDLEARLSAALKGQG